jgi:hypothetical protein
MKRRSFLQSVLGLGALVAAPKLAATPIPIAQPIVTKNGIGDYTIDLTQVKYTGNGSADGPFVYCKYSDPRGFVIFDTKRQFNG